METENGELVQELHNRGIERTNQRVRKDLQRFRRERQELIEGLHIGVDPVETENRGREEQLEQQRMTAVEGLVLQGLEVEEITDDMITDKINEMEPKMQPCLADRELLEFMVFADVECQLDETNTFVPIVICFVREDDDPIYHHWGKNCIQEFIKTMIEWKNSMDLGTSKEIHIFFHNMRGFDGIFIIKMYEMTLKVEKVLSTGPKKLYFKHHTKTFNFQELKKGWFPHKFNTPQNFDYVGAIFDLEYYEPQHMRTKNKEALEKWHAEQVLKWDVWNMKNEMLEYCKSDLKLLKEGCMKVVQDFEKEAGFNPLIQCITIASACHYFWGNNQMEPKTIAIEPIVGWGGLRMNQSVVALHWLYNQDKKLGGNRIKHSPNEGEQVILLKEGKVKVDGYDPVTKTVYEFHGCEFDGCKKCKPNDRHVKTFHHPDRTMHEMFKVTKMKIT